MLSMSFGATHIALTLASFNPVAAGVEFGLAIIVPLMIMGIGGVYVLGLRTRPGKYVGTTTTDFANVSCRSRAGGCLVSLIGLALLIGGALFLLSHG